MNMELSKRISEINSGMIPEGYVKAEYGVYPEEWDIVTVKSVGKLRKGKGISNKDLCDWGKQCITYGQIYTKYNDVVYCLESSISSQTALKSEKIAYGDILFSGSGETINDIGKAVTYLGEEEAYAGGDIIILTSEKINPEYFGFAFNSNNVVKQKMKYGQGFPVVHIYSNGISDIEIAIPSKNEQESIAEILRNLKRLISLQEKRIALAKKELDYWKKLFVNHKLLEKEYNISTCEYRLEEIANYTNGLAHEMYVDESGEYILVNSKYIASGGKIYKKVLKGDVFLKKEQIAMVLSDVPNGKAIAKCYFSEADNTHVLNQRICSIGVKSDKVIPKYLYYYLDRNPYFLAYDNKVSQTNLRKGDVEKCPIFLPAIDSQLKIVEVLNNMTKKIELLELQNSKTKEKFTKIRELLVKGYLRVKS